MMEKAFTRLLMNWHKKENTRKMPWKGEKDPYRIWLSEIILQQTRVSQGLAYYEAFVKKYPNIHLLASANDATVFKLWEGLGYYNRCKNLLHTARTIVNEHEGVFPNQYNDLLALKGIGSYTAAAIASFAYDLPYAVVDGNVFRVLSRYFGITEPIDSSQGKELYAQLANRLLDITAPGSYNQAIMDFGAMVCKPFSPHCSSCPLQKKCTAFREGLVSRLPFKEKSIQRKLRWFYYFVFETDGKIMVRKRTGKDIWQNLYEPYLLESDKSVFWDEKSVKDWLKEVAGIKKAEMTYVSEVITQQLTHQQIKGQFIRIKLPATPGFLARYEQLPAKNLRKRAFPRFVTQHFESALFQNGS